MVRRRSANTHRDPPRNRRSQNTWNLSLYIAGENPRGRLALENLTRICTAYLPGRFRIQVIDLKRTPLRAKADGIVALPTVIRRSPGPERRMIGNVSDMAKALARLGLPA